MRFVVQISFPVEKFNQAIRDGTAADTIGRILESTRPEAAYFSAKDGRRGCYLIVDVASASDIPGIAEPWFLNFDATVEFLPAMTPADLQQAGLDELARKWGG